ncbi:unnamed protein product [Paramecium sonneborni]|uniref:Uncharacterized protein n=1 Tax=Paramecium sonneborni TaxID=65129 RepID=A0A8S1QXL5_9CILI|nr:unnamed protein product [Paramecium sonneborni]
MSNLFIKNVLETQVIYTKDEKEIRLQESFENKRKQLQQIEIVQKYKQDKLSISLISDCQQNYQRQIKEPICIKSCSHKIYDLYDLFFSDVESECEKCGTQFKIKNIPQENILLEKTYKHFVQFSNERAYFCSFYGSQVFHAYLETYQNQARALLQKEVYEQNFQQIDIETDQEERTQQLLIELEKETSSYINQIQKIHRMSLQCLIDASKINIPIIFQGCKHSLRCYEYTNILKLIEQNLNLPEFLQKDTIPCFMKDCQNQISLDMKKLIQDKQIYFPGQIAQQISKDYGFTLGIDWCYQSNQFVYNHLKLDQFPLLKPYQNICEKAKNHFFLFFGLTAIIKCEQNEDFNNKLNYSKYTINLNNIIYPTRCYFCPLNKAFDLISFLSQILNQNAINYFSFDKTFKLTKPLNCPACQKPFKIETFLHELIYFDKFLAQEMEFLKDFQNAKINERKNLRLYLIKFQQLKQHQRLKQYQLEQINLYPSNICQIKKNRMVDPLVLPLCQNKRAFDIENFVQYMESKNYQLNDFYRNYPCNCSFCCYRNFRLNDFYFDITFKSILVWFKSDELWEQNVLYYLRKESCDNNQSPQKPKIIILKEEKPKKQINQTQQQFNNQQNNFQNQMFQIQQFDLINYQQKPQLNQQQQNQQQQNQKVYYDKETYAMINGTLINTKLLENWQHQ